MLDVLLPLAPARSGTDLGQAGNPPASFHPSQVLLVLLRLWGIDAAVPDGDSYSHPFLRVCHLMPQGAAHGDTEL